MNTQEYLAANQMILFTESASGDGYKIGEKVNPITYQTTCSRFPVEVTVATAMVDFGGFTIACAVTTQVKINHLLNLNGFGSHCHHDEAKTMESAIAAYCEKFGYVICKKVNSWPYAVAMITNFNKGFVGIDPPQTGKRN